MTTLVELKQWMLYKIKEHPQYKEQIVDFWYLCQNEISEGASVQNEIYLCMDSVEQLIEGNDEE